MKATTMLVALAGALGCAASGAQPADPVTRVEITSGLGALAAAEIHNEPGRAVTTLPVPVDTVWAALPRAYERLGIPGVGAAPGERTYGARDARPRRIEGKRLSTYLDCGMGPTATPKADEYRVMLTIVTRVEPEGPASTTVETVTHATARPRDTAGAPVTCQSNGALETRVAELVAWVLAGGR